MKILGVFLIVVGILCFAFALTELVAWTTPVSEGATPASLSGTIDAKMLILSGLDFVRCRWDDCIYRGHLDVARYNAKERGLSLGRGMPGKLRNTVAKARLITYLTL